MNRRRFLERERAYRLGATTAAGLLLPEWLLDPPKGRNMVSVPDLFTTNLDFTWDEPTWTFKALLLDGTPYEAMPPRSELPYGIGGPNLNKDTTLLRLDVESMTFHEIGTDEYSRLPHQ
jgi:hypothetical protein